MSLKYFAMVESVCDQGIVPNLMSGLLEYGRHNLLSSIPEKKMNSSVEFMKKIQVKLTVIFVSQYLKNPQTSRYDKGDRDSYLDFQTFSKNRKESNSGMYLMFPFSTNLRKLV